MKNRYKLSFKWLVGIATCSGVLLTSCNDYLDITPPSDIPPELYLNEENELATYVNGLYGYTLMAFLVAMQERITW